MSFLGKYFLWAHQKKLIPNELNNEHALFSERFFSSDFVIDMKPNFCHVCDFIPINHFSMPIKSNA